jgi:hypothetical protein
LDPGSRIRDEQKSGPGNRDKDPGSATLLIGSLNYLKEYFKLLEKLFTVISRFTGYEEQATICSFRHALQSYRTADLNPEFYDQTLDEFSVERSSWPPNAIRLKENIKL